jgi:hypothetical protein
VTTAPTAPTAGTPRGKARTRARAARTSLGAARARGGTVPAARGVAGARTISRCRGWANGDTL